MSWTLGVITDGRIDYLAETLRSAATMLPEPHRRIIIDDSGEPDCRAWIRTNYPDFEFHGHHRRLGLAATVRDLWDRVDTDYLFHLEDDFTFNRPVPIRQLAEASNYGQIAQVCLIRQPWSPPERERGTILPDDIREHGELLIHDKLFSLNPCLIPRTVVELGWDDDNEAGFTRTLLAAGYRFAYWGRGDPWVTHIGERSSLFGGAGRR